MEFRHRLTSQWFKCGYLCTGKQRYTQWLSNWQKPHIFSLTYEVIPKEGQVGRAKWKTFHAFEKMSLKHNHILPGISRGYPNLQRLKGRRSSGSQNTPFNSPICPGGGQGGEIWWWQMPSNWSIWNLIGINMVIKSSPLGQEYCLCLDTSLEIMYTPNCNCSHDFLIRS